MINDLKESETETRVQKKEDASGLSPKILELRKKIQNKEYLDNAIQRIAQVISNHLIENPEELKLRD